MVQSRILESKRRELLRSSVRCAAFSCFFEAFKIHFVRQFASGCRPLPATWVSDLCARKVEFFERLLAEMQWSAMSLPARGLGTGPCFQLVTRRTIRLAARVNLSNGFKRAHRKLSGDGFAWSDWGATRSGSRFLTPLFNGKVEVGSQSCPHYRGSMRVYSVSSGGDSPSGPSSRSNRRERFLLGMLLGSPVTSFEQGAQPFFYLFDFAPWHRLAVDS
jgi:hypothetical protein